MGDSNPRPADGESLMHVPFTVNTATRTGVMRYRTISYLHIIAPFISLSTDPVGRRYNQSAVNLSMIGFM